MHNIADILKAQPSVKIAKSHIRYLRKIHDIWLELMNKEVAMHAGINNMLIEKSIPASIQNNTLYVSCETAVIANHFRYETEAILQTLQSKGIQHINNIEATVDITASWSNSTQSNPHIQRMVHQQTINALEQLVTTSKSETLCSAIENLLSQLKNRLNG